MKYCMKKRPFIELLIRFIVQSAVATCNFMIVLLFGTLVQFVLFTSLMYVNRSLNLCDLYGIHRIQLVSAGKNEIATKCQTTLITYFLLIEVFLVGPQKF